MPGAAEDMTAAYRRVFATREGEMVLSDILHTAQLFNNPYAADPREQERINGQRDLGFYILDRLGVRGGYDQIVKALLSIPAKPKTMQEVAHG